MYVGELNGSRDLSRPVKTCQDPCHGESLASQLATLVGRATTSSGCLGGALHATTQACFLLFLPKILHHNRRRRRPSQSFVIWESEMKV